MLPTFDGVLDFLSSIGRRPEGACLFETASQDNLFRQIAENIGDVIWMTDYARNAMLYISPSYERIWGHSCESLYRDPKSWADAICEEDRARVWESVRTRQREGTYDLTYRIVRPDGSRRWIHDRAFPIRDERGRVYRIVGLASDITERRLAEESTRRLAAIVQSANVAILFITPDKTIVEWNAGAERLFGYSAAEAIGGPLSILHPPERLDEIRRGLEVLDSGRPWVIDTQRRHKDGHLVDVSLSGCALLDEGGRITGYAGLYRDITECKYEDENRVLRERERVQREMMAMLSHDLRTPLAAIKGFAETLRTGGLADARRRLSFVRVIERHADKLGKLVDNMLAQSYFEQGRRRSERVLVDLRQFVAEHAAGLEPIIRKRQIQLLLELERLAVRADPAELAQILQNLIDNAVKFTPRGGTVRILARRENGFALVSVIDSGPGVADGDLERIFERFQRGERNRHVRGTGLGLFIARKMVEAVGGRIWAGNASGEGACFRFTLPLAEGAASSSD